MKHKFLTILLLILLVILTICVLNRDCLLKTQRDKENGVREEGFQDKPSFILYHVNWCGYCKECKPKFERLLEDVSITDKCNIEMKDAEAPENKGEIEEKHIHSYPTILFSSNGNDEDYKGPRELNNFKQFINERC